MRKIITLLCCLCVSSSVLAAKEVVLIEAKSSLRSGCFGCIQFEGVIQVENLAFEKSVQVLITDTDNNEEAIAARYASTDALGRERWTFVTQIPPWEADPLHFSLVYAVGGEEFSDDNTGATYPITLGDSIYGESDYVELKELRTFGNSASCVDCETARGAVIVENLGFDKKVKVSYTSDNADTGEIFAHYSHSLDGNKEVWIFEQEFDAAQSKLATFSIVYEVDGSTYADSNGGFQYGSKPLWLDAFYGNSEAAIGETRVFLERQLGCFGCALVKGSVMLKNIDFSKRVTVSYLNEDGELIDISAVYQAGPFQSGYERWSFTGLEFIAAWEPQPDHVIVSYEVAGDIYSQAVAIQ